MSDRLTNTRSIASDKSLRVLPVIGTRGARRETWMIVNSLGGLVDYFEGSKVAAEAHAMKLEKARG